MIFYLFASSYSQILSHSIVRRRLTYIESTLSVRNAHISSYFTLRSLFCLSLSWDNKPTLRHDLWIGKTILRCTHADKCCSCAEWGTFSKEKYVQDLWPSHETITNIRRTVNLGASSDQAPVFGQQDSSAKSKLVHLIGAVQTLLRSKYWR